MTQLSLFDLPSTTAADSSAPSVVAVPPANYSVTAPAAKTETQPARRRRRRKGSASNTASLNATQGNIEGVQRMGDLARFVIMRYELAVKYREEMEAQRRQAAK